MVLWVDTFTDGMNPEIATAAAKVLAGAGYHVVVPDQVACCGLTWITTGQLDGARSRLRRLLDILGPYAAQGIPIVGLEPSCTAVLRSDLLDLLPDDPRAAQVAGLTRTLAEQLSSRDGTPDAWAPPDLTDVEILVQPHCHHHAVMGFDTDRKLLVRLRGDGLHRQWLLRTRRQLRHGKRTLRHVGRCRRECAATRPA